MHALADPHIALQPDMLEPLFSKLSASARFTSLARSEAAALEVKSGARFQAPWACHGVRSTPMVVIGLAATLGMLLYVGQGILAAAQLIGFTLGWLIPSAALVGEISPIRRLPATLRALVAFSLAILLTTPAFYFRRLLPVPQWSADGLLVLAICGLALKRGSYMRFLGDLTSPVFRASAPFLFVVLPALFTLVWMGYEVHDGRQALYYGLYPIDFANLTSIVALINASHGLPHGQVAGTAVLSYHWLFFAFPAWLGSFGKGAVPAASSLAICNYVAACTLFLVICVVIERARRVMDPDRTPAASTAVLTAGVVTLASLVMYPYQLLSRLAAQVTQISSLGISLRNGLLLSLPNSMAVFGNNTMAVALALLVLALLVEWNREPRKGYLLLAGGLLASITGYSVTLFFPMGLAIGLWLLLGKVHRWPVAALWMGIAGAGVLSILDFGLHLFGSSRGPAVSFDGGAYLRHIVFALLPLWILAWMGRAYWRKLSLFWETVACGIVVPSFLYVPHSVTGQTDFSMKIATLIAVAASPLAYAGLVRWRQNWRAPVGLAAAALTAAGLVCTAVYAGQFAFMRVRHDNRRALQLPLDYVKALQFLRDHTPREAIVIDPQSVSYPLSIPTNFVGERRVYLPTQYTEAVAPATLELAGEMVRRTSEFEQWERSGFADRILSKRFAAAADYCLVAGDSLAEEDWLMVQRFGKFSLWESRLRRKA